LSRLARGPDAGVPGQARGPAKHAVWPSGAV